MSYLVEVNDLNSISGQRNLLGNLTKLILPGKFKEVVKMAIPSLILIPNKLSEPSKSHFVGLPKLPEGTDLPVSNEKEELMHIFTLMENDIPDEIECHAIKDYLSFYLNVKESLNRWPDQEGDFKVFNYSRKTTSQYTLDHQVEDEINFDTYLLLEMPRPDHSVITSMKFKDEEEEAYEVLQSVYKKLLPRGEESEESCKLFGYPDSVQNCASFEAERIKNKKDFTNVNFANDVERIKYTEEIIAKAVKWKLLLQISPYSSSLRFFEDFRDGTIYYMIKEDDLAGGNFSDIQLVVQNT